MTRIRMLALDVDGTLAARGDEVTPATRAALARATDAGIEVVIATGRRFRSTARVIDALGRDVAAVCLGGALVKEHDRRTLHQAPLAPDETRTLLGLLRAEGLAFVGQRDSLDRGGADFVIDGGVRWAEPIARYIEANRDHAEARDDLDTTPPDDVLVVGTFGERDALTRVAERLLATNAGRFTTTLMSSPWGDVSYLEIVAAHVSKWSALEHLAALRGVPGEAVCAVGDELNDVSMVRGSGLGVAMHNAHDDLKAVADFVCGRHDEDGLVEVVDAILAR